MKVKVCVVLPMLGPVEMVMVEFPGNKFKGEIMPALDELVERKMIRIIDLVFVIKDAKGKAKAIELESVDKETAKFFGKLGVEVSGLISEEDIRRMMDMLPPNTSAGILLFEHLWAKKFRDATLRANGRLVMNERIPVAVIEEALKSKKVLKAD
ncbi:MAG: DUF6325 family protein [Methanomicrobiales archaeon]|nr:DUF6325 family protein [Methanomicrobiales archaeon]MDD1659231.1 DUF6325 family protein [Methanomicrobiales archaeon]